MYRRNRHLSELWRALAAMTPLDRITTSRRLLFLATVLLIAPLAHGLLSRPAQAQAPAQAALPAPPRALVDTTLTPPSGRKIAVATGGDLQAALNSAQPGDVISLEAGAVFQGNFRLPKKAGSGWIIVRSGASDEKFPAPGTRVTPAVAPLMPKLVSPNSNPAVFTEPGAHHYRIIGVEFATAAGVKDIYSIVAFGGDQTSDADTPHDLILDRCYVHGHDNLAARRGVLLNSASTAVIDSTVSEIHAAGYDSQAILGYNGPGPFKISNNFLEGAAENVMFGGADPAIRGLVPSDIEIRANHFFKPLSWLPGNPGFSGAKWTIKNLLEFKNAQRVLVEGNLFENNTGPALLLTPRNQGGSAPWSVVQDILFRSNLVRNAATGFIALSTDNERPSQPTKRITIFNNLWLGVTRTFFGMGAGPGGFEDFVIDHNTAIPVGHSAYYAEGGPPAVVRFRMTNNLVGFGSYGVTFASGAANLAQALPYGIITRNALVNLADTADGQGAARNRPPAIDQTMYTSFPSAAAAGVNDDGTLSTKSPNRRTATDGKDVGVDFDELRRVGLGQHLGK
jgi:hypothetical protein